MGTNNREARGEWRRSLDDSRLMVVGVETGGTKTVFGLAAADDPTRVLMQRRVETTSPDVTLAIVASAIAEWSREMPITALGLASFGPIDVSAESPTYGTIFDTPKQLWEGTSVLQGLEVSEGMPVVVYNDVTAAAFGETSPLEAATGNLLYMTVGTGIGVGITLQGRPIQGRGYPEAGHLLVRRHPSDTFEGVCPFHGDCAEGIAAGPAVRARASQAQPTSEILEAVAYTLAQVILSGLNFTAAQTVVIGGGVTSIKNLREATARHLASLRAPSAPPEMRAPRYEHSGLVGAMLGAARLVDV